MKTSTLLPVVAYLAFTGTVSAAPVASNNDTVEKRWCLFGFLGTSCGTTTTTTTTSASVVKSAASSASSSSSAKATTSSAATTSVKSTASSVTSSSVAKTSAVSSVQVVASSASAAKASPTSWAQCSGFDWSPWSSGWTWGGGYSLQYVQDWYVDNYGYNPPTGMSWDQVSSLVSKFGAKTTTVGPIATSKYSKGCHNPWTAPATPTAQATSAIVTSKAVVASASSSSAKASVVSSVVSSSTASSASKSSASASAAATSASSSAAAMSQSSVNSSVVNKSSAAASSVAASSAVTSSAAASSVAASSVSASSVAASSVAASSVAASSVAASSVAASSVAASSVAASSVAASSAAASSVLFAASSSVSSTAQASASQSSLVSASANGGSAASPVISSVAPASSDTSSIASPAPASATDAAAAAGSGTTGSGSGSVSATDGSNGNATATATSAVAPSATTVSMVNGYTYGGCAQEISGRLLPDVQTSSSSQSIESCTALCMSHGYGVAGLEYGSECYCGTIDDASTATVSGQCYMPCSGNSDEICGGPNAINWYYNPDVVPATVVLPTGWTTYGVVNEGDGGRALTYQLWSSSSNTVQSCAQGCAQAGYTVSGTEYSSECYCGNGFSNGGGALLDSSSAFMHCSGDLAEICGGPSILSVVSALGNSIPQI